VEAPLTPADPSDPRRYEAEARSLEGARVHLRAIRPDDKRALAEGFARLSDRSVHFRFFSAKRRLTEQELRRFTELDFRTHVALVAEMGDPLAPVGVGRYVVRDGERSERAEVAFAVDDAHQGHGIGTLLLRHLAAIARAQGLAAFEAEVLGDNRTMLEVFEHSGLAMTRRSESGGVVRVTLALGAPDGAHGAGAA
jgi:GNAT superfamily N-acetyltransferase